MGKYIVRRKGINEEFKEVKAKLWGETTMIGKRGENKKKEGYGWRATRTDDRNVQQVKGEEN
jgi:restriction endonuclease S subunit